MPGPASRGGMMTRLRLECGCGTIRYFPAREWQKAADVGEKQGWELRAGCWVCPDCQAGERFRERMAE